MTEFSKKWNTEVKALAKDCVPEPRLMEIFSKGNNYELSEEEKEYIKSISNKYKDIFGMYHIYNMIWQVEHALADGRQEIAIIALTNVYEVINSPSYFLNVFSKDEENEEWKRIKKLREGLYNLLYK